MKVTLKDIAEDTGYSISTVSRVLNGSDKISTKTRREIYQSAKKLKYPVYRSIEGDTLVDRLNVSLVLTRFHIGEFYASFYNGLNLAAQKHNIQLSMTSSHKAFDETLKTIKELCSQKTDGLILFAPEFGREEYLRIRDELPQKYPVVSNGLIENPVFSTVTFDGYSGGFLAAEHFKKRGYRNCGIIRGPFEKAEARYRSNGFRDHIQQEKNLELVWDFHGDFTFQSGKTAFQDFDSLERKPRAIFASNDAMCHSFMEEALMNGYKFPDDIAIMGYDDLPICKRHRPTISSIHTNYQKLGEVTMEKLKELLSNAQQPKGVLSLVPVTLEKRQSS